MISFDSIAKISFKVKNEIKNVFRQNEKTLLLVFYTKRNTKEIN